MSTIEVKDADLIRHTLGAVSGNPRNTWGYRNRFCCGAGDRPAMDRLAAAGLMRPVGTPNELSGGDQFFVATEAGCDFIGLTPSQKKRAFSD